MNRAWPLCLSPALVLAAWVAAPAQAVAADARAAVDSVAAAPAAPEAPSPAGSPADSVSVPHAVRAGGAQGTVRARARRTIGTVLADSWTVASSPARVRGTDWIWIGAAVGAGAVIFANDQEIADAMIRNDDQPVLKQVADLGDRIEPVGLMSRTVPVYAVALASGYAFHVRALRRIPAEILESHLLSGGLRNVVKTLVGRQRPNENEGPYKFKFGKGTSFPSGHSSIGFELATIASMNAHFLPVTIAAYSLAATLAFERVDSRSHWPSDAYAGAIYGTLVARAVVKVHEQRDRGKEPGLALVPCLSSDGRTPEICVRRSF